MRGKADYESRRKVGNRITPAYAGKSIIFGFLDLEVEDHPRLCGEKLLFPLPTVRVMGSPPPMRGKGNPWDWFFTGTRITPAYAGKRRLLRRMTQTMRDHPRLCGEKQKKHHPQQQSKGSPPPMRGKD